MKRFGVFAFCIALLNTAIAAPVTPELVTAHIESKGTQSARDTYFSCDDTAKAQGYDLVETGAEPWLRIAARLVRDSDGCYTLGLQSSIALAILHNPEGVLELVDSHPKLEAAYICIPFMADETDPVKLAEQIKTLNSLELALARVKTPRLAAQKAKCVERVHSLKNDLISQLNGESGATH